MIKPLYGSGVHRILLARVKGQVSSSVLCGGRENGCLARMVFKALSVDSAVVFYSTQLFDALIKP